MNVFTVSGRLTKDAEQRYTANEKAVLGFTIACDVGYGERKHAIFVECSLWGKRGEALAPYLTKGSQVTASGTLDLRKWESEGKNGASLDLNVNDIILQGGTKPAQQESGFRQAEPAKAAPAEEGLDDEDIPF